MYWFWLKRNIYNTIRCKISKLYDDDDDCIACILSPPHSPCCRLLTTATPQMSGWLSCGRCRLLSDQNHIGCHNEKISPNNNTTHYPISANIAQYPITQCQYRSNRRCDVVCVLCSGERPKQETSEASGATSSTAGLSWHCQQLRRQWLQAGLWWRLRFRSSTYWQAVVLYSRQCCYHLLLMFCMHLIG